MAIWWDLLSLKFVNRRVFYTNKIESYTILIQTRNDVQFLDIVAPLKSLQV